MSYPHTCKYCGEEKPNPEEICGCYTEIEEDEGDDFIVGGVPLGEIPAMTREEFYEMLTDDPMYGGLVDPDDQEIVLIATILSLDKKIQDLLKRVAVKE